MPTATLRPHNLKHLSHSQYTSYLDCAHGYELGRLTDAPKIPAWWFLGGSTVHEVTEKLDWLRLVKSDVSIDIKTETQKKLDELVEKELRDKGLTNFDGWFAGGRWPSKNGYEWWSEHAPQMVERYVAWHEKRIEQGWWIADFNGVPGIECDLDVSFDFGQFRGAPDRVFRLPSGQLVVADIKSGSTLPKSPLQLGTYANDLEMLGFERPAYGTYVMVKEDPKKGHEVHTPLVPLDKYQTPYLEKIYGSVYASIELGSFAPNVGDACRTCVVQRACYAVGGEDSARYDRLDPNYRGSLN